MVVKLTDKSLISVEKKDDSVFMWLKNMNRCLKPRSPQSTEED